jgi:hypothetical protein
MSKTHLISDLQQAIRFCGGRRAGTDSKHSDARHSSAGLPTGSAAANSSTRCVSSGSRSTRCRKLSSIRPDSGNASGSPNPPANSAGASPRGSSRRASGFPCVSATIRSATRSSSGPGITDFKSSLASASGRPPSTTSGRPLSSSRSCTSRVAKSRTPTRPAVGAPQTPVPARKQRRAAGRRQSRTEAVAMKPPPTTTASRAADAASRIAVASSRLRRVKTPSRSAPAT